MTSNTATMPMADWPSISTTARESRAMRPVQPRPEWNPQHQASTSILDPSMQSPETEAFGRELRSRIVGQDRAIRQLMRVYQAYLAGLSAPGRPLANLLLLGPTGSGKTRLVEAAAEVLFGDSGAVVKIDCAEFQHSHEIAKLVGSPPGYLGHRETSPLITQDALERHYTDKVKVSLVLFDEIEKASDALWQLLLGILDKGTLTLGDNRRVDFSQSLIFLTSNLGSHEISKLMDGGLGYISGARDKDEDLDQKVYRTAVDAARRKFSPEFMNRMDKVIVFRTLQREHLEKILDIELEHVQERIMSSAVSRQFVFRCAASARDFLLEEGMDSKFGARHLKRSIERHLVSPLSNLLATNQIELGDLVTISCDDDACKLSFVKEPCGALLKAETKPHPEPGWAPVMREQRWMGEGMQCA
jgi:ATP-dependent Clp protease ATP-binding subunit ClpB